MFTVMVATMLLVPVLLVGVVMTVIVLASRSTTPVRALGASALPRSAPPSGRWQVRTHAGGQLTSLGARFGVLALWEGRLGLTYDGDTAPAWVVPCQQLRASPLGAFTLSGSDLRLEGPFGSLDVVVSQERINRIMDNDLKDARESRYARELLGMLQASGAYVTA
ncbi:hypothetical protein [Luteipulveratus flavus]|uniref:DUF2550 domain-containing protein n=1 Tax=Luteipulveratus flavus TaxID=3031728 RepID=A0ABT6CA68_9MICO|nr:hypothetical protein [Luteipulveratus sp. YIM 133296]MDF8265690.1 hypothetical protein [Luteipulveratus sp. YIM 133296]